MRTRNETPVKYTGKRGTTWKARYTNAAGKRVSAGTFERKGPCRTPSLTADCCAQHAIDAAYDKEDAEAERHACQTVGEFAKTWPKRYPRGKGTNKANVTRLNAILDVELEGRKLRDWPYRDLRRRHAVDLLNVLLDTQGRAAEGARGILRTLSAMTQDALGEEVAEVNPFMGIRVRDDDVRLRKVAREPQIYTFEQMHAFAAANPKHEAMIRVLADCGFRLGEMLGLDRTDFDGANLSSRGTALPNGTFVAGDTRTKKHVRTVPVPPSCATLIAPRIDTIVLFPTTAGKRWDRSNFYKRVWQPARDACPDMADATPQDFRHSWVSNLRALGIDPADLADMGGHAVDTADGIYTHALRRSADAVRKAIG